jgi:hypothetical protein
MPSLSTSLSASDIIAGLRVGEWVQEVAIPLSKGGSTRVSYDFGRSHIPFERTVGVWGQTKHAQVDGWLKALVSSQSVAFMGCFPLDYVYGPGVSKADYRP